MELIGGGPLGGGVASALVPRIAIVMVTLKTIQFTMICLGSYSGASNFVSAYPVMQAPRIENGLMQTLACPGTNN